ncbi:T9SS sorting signal type C domain-containing protein [Flavobacterium flavipallidum]|uniref:T9SS sorting signal type C domain-containing protein n=1 Tax=Flavobacterium flavipallidum TaxID=3139140 RepID=A0ABU9HLH2_9FLAO
MRFILFKRVFFVFLLFGFSIKAICQVATSGSTYVWSSGSTWTPSAVPLSTNNVTVNSPLTLDQNLTISTGSYTFNQDVTDQPGGSNYNLTNVNASGSLTIASGTTTIGGVTSIGGNSTFTLTVKNGATLILGTLGSTSNNFLIGDKVVIVIEQGASLIVYGNIVNSNSSGTFTVNGLLQVYGNYSTNNGNIDISGTTGQFYTTGSMSTQGSSDIYGSGNECASNCSGTSLGCGSGGNAYTATIAPQSQTICSGATPTTLTFTTNAPVPTYQWEYSSSAGGTYTAVPSAISNTYTPSSLTVTTWYRVKYSSTSCTGFKYSAPVPVYVSASTYTQSTAGQTVCGGSFGPISVSAYGTGLTYQWYSNTTASNSDGTSISGATSNVYTPSSASSGTKYYYCVINSSCGAPFTTAVSGAFTVNLNTVSSASSSSLCVDALMTSITHTTTGATGIGLPTGLPAGVTASWASNTITISGTPTVSGTFNYSIPLTGGCGSVNATGTLIVNELPNNVTNGFAATTICAGGSPHLTFDAIDATFSTPYSITYKNDTTLNQYTVSIPSASAYSFTPGDNPTSNATYTLVSISNATCTNTNVLSFNDSGASLYVRPIPTATISGTTSVCVGDISPNITFTNPQTVSITITYNINGGANQTIDIVGGSFANVAVATSTAGTFVYNLVSVIYKTPSICSNPISGSATVTVNPNLAASVAIAASPSGAICSGSNVTFTATPTNGGTMPTYQWKLNGSNVGVNSDTYANSTLSNGDVVSCVMTSNASPCLTGSPTTSNAITMVVNPIPVVPTVGTITHPTCAAATGSFVISNYNASYTYMVSPSSGVSVVGALVTAPSGNYTIASNVSGCTSANVSFTINTQPVTPSAPVVGTITQPSCTLDTGSVELTGLPTGTWTLYRSGTSASTITGTGSSIVISGLADGGSFTFTVSNGACTSVASDPVNIDAISIMTSTWNGSTWVNGTPDSSKRIVFAGNFSSTDNVTGCSCKVSSGANVVINSAHTLTVTNGVDVETNGSLTFENNASLVQISDAAINTGIINYKRFTTPVRRYDFTYWSSPVVGQTLYNLSPNTLFDKYYGYNPNTGWFIYYNGAAVMQPGNGYSIRAPETFSITDQQVDADPVFIGVPNNGEVKMVLAANKFYLLGNPYPSAIDAAAFLGSNSSVLEGTLYFWTHNTPPSATVSGSASYKNYSNNDYATFNLTGTVSTATKAGSGGYLPSGKIAAGQGFFAPSSSAGGMLTFNNSMRVGGGSFGVNNSQFFKLKTSEKSRIWLNLTNKEEVFKQILIGYLEGATNEYDKGFDGSILNINNDVDFYSVNQGHDLVIQGRALPFNDADVVVLGYHTSNEGSFQISIDQIDGLLNSQDIYLEDNYLNIVHDLKKEPYSFVTEKGTFDNRFVLRYSDKKSEVLSLDKKILVSVKANAVKLNSSELISKVSIYNVLGQLVYQSDSINLKDFWIENLNLAHQVLFVKVELVNNEKSTVKIVY